MVRTMVPNGTPGTYSPMAIVPWYHGTMVLVVEIRAADIAVELEPQL